MRFFTDMYISQLTFAQSLLRDFVDIHSNVTRKKSHNKLPIPVSYNLSVPLP